LGISIGLDMGHINFTDLPKYPNPNPTPGPGNLGSSFFSLELSVLLK
jgi:hypothetical protein